MAIEKIREFKKGDIHCEKTEIFKYLGYYNQVIGLSNRDNYKLS